MTLLLETDFNVFNVRSDERRSPMWEILVESLTVEDHSGYQIYYDECRCFQTVASSFIYLGIVIITNVSAVRITVLCK